MYSSVSSSSHENLLRAIRFERPDFIPMTFHINDACWTAYPYEALFELIESHPFLFPDYVRPQEPYVPQYSEVARKDAPYTDGFGCLWQTTENGITGSVHVHPLKDWAAYKSYRLPDPEHSTGLLPIDWAAFEAEVRCQKALGKTSYGDLRHGHTFLQLVDIRGYEDLLMDMVDEEPLLDDLICRLEEFNMAQIRHFLRADVDIVRIPEDLGMQVGPMLSPDCFRRYIKPSYQRMIGLVRQAGKIVHMHSDGDIRLLADDIIDGGVHALNLQDLVNGVDWIAENLKGRVCIDLDIDRQKITPYGTPAQVDALIRDEIAKLGSKDGGLMMIYGLYPGVPLENVRAVMDAMEKYAFYYG